MPKQGDQSSSPFVTTTESPPAAIHFDPDDPKYKCCCKCCHVRTGTLVIGIFDTIFLGINLIQWAMLFINFPENPQLHILVPLIAGIVYFGWGVLAAIGLFVAICKDRPKWLWPRVALQCAIIALAVASCIWVIVLVCSNRKLLNLSKEEEPTPLITYGEGVNDAEAEGGSENMVDDGRDVISFFFMILILVVCVLYILLQVWFLLVLRRCYLFLCEKEAWKRAAFDHPTVVMYSTAPAAYEPKPCGDAPPAYETSQDSRLAKETEALYPKIENIT